jgi:hypothetical protein
VFCPFIINRQRAGNEYGCWQKGGLLKVFCEFQRLLSVTSAQSCNCSDFRMIQQ